MTLPTHGTAPGTWLPVRTLTADAFAAYGNVIELSPGNRQWAINDGNCVRHHDLARPFASDASAEPGAVGLSLFDAAATPLPTTLRRMERHRLGSQAFAPFGAALQMLLVVADADIPAEELRPEHLVAFITDGRQGIQLRAGTWHHPLVSLQAGAWLVVDRIVQEVDCEVVVVQAWGVRCTP